MIILEITLFHCHVDDRCQSSPVNNRNIALVYPGRAYGIIIEYGKEAAGLQSQLLCAYKLKFKNLPEDTLTGYLSGRQFSAAENSVTKFFCENTKISIKLSQEQE